MFKSPIAKAIVAGIALIAGTLNAAFGDNVFTMDEKQQAISTTLLVILGIYSVWKTPNTPKDDVK